MAACIRQPMAGHITMRLFGPRMASILSPDLPLRLWPIQRRLWPSWRDHSAIVMLARRKVGECLLHFG